MAQTVLRQVLILAVMMMLGFLLGKRGKVDRKGADILSMLLLDVFFPCNILAAASGDFGDMPFSQVIKIALAYMSCFILFTLLAKPIAKLLRLNEDDSLVFTRSVAYPNNGFVGIPLCTAVFGTEGTVLGSLSVPCATLYMFLFIMQSFRREKDHNLKQQLKSMLTPMNISAVLMIIMLATGWKFTGAPLQFLSSLANCVLPTSMIIIGCLLSDSPRTRADLPQYRFAAQINGGSLLNYGTLDGGFYTAAGVLPPCKYFCVTNMPLDDQWTDQQAVLKAGAVDYVVALTGDLHGDFPQYAVIDRCSYDGGEGEVTWYLYQLQR